MHPLKHAVAVGLAVVSWAAHQTAEACQPPPDEWVQAQRLRASEAPIVVYGKATRGEDGRVDFVVEQSFGPDERSGTLHLNDSRERCWANPMVFGDSYLLTAEPMGLMTGFDATVVSASYRKGRPLPGGLASIADIPNEAAKAAVLALREDMDIQVRRLLQAAHERCKPLFDDDPGEPLKLEMIVYANGRVQATRINVQDLVGYKLSNRRIVDQLGPPGIELCVRELADDSARINGFRGDSVRLSVTGEASTDGLSIRDVRLTAEPHPPEPYSDLFVAVARQIATADDPPRWWRGAPETKRLKAELDRYDAPAPLAAWIVAQSEANPDEVGPSFAGVLEAQNKGTRAPFSRPRAAYFVSWLAELLHSGFVHDPWTLTALGDILVRRGGAPTDAERRTAALAYERASTLTSSQKRKASLHALALESLPPGSSLIDAVPAAASPNADRERAPMGRDDGLSAPPIASMVLRKFAGPIGGALLFALALLVAFVARRRR